MKFKSLELKTENVKSDGFFFGYGSVFGVRDRYGDVVHQGAFTNSLKAWKEKGKMPKMLWQHDFRQPIGIWENISEDNYGLKMEGRLLIEDVARAREAYALLKAGALDGLSIGYGIDKARWEDETDTLHLLSLELMETSIVTFPANDEATIHQVKSTFKHQLPTLREFEKFLREAGFSKSQATTIASRGLRALLGEPVHEKSVEISHVLNILKTI